MKFIKKHFDLLLLVALVALIGLFGYRLNGESPKVVDISGLIVSCTLLLLSFGVAFSERALDALKELTPKQCGRCKPPQEAVIFKYGYDKDQADETEIVSKGLTAPRVTAEQIQALMAQVSWRYEQPEGTTSTFAHAFLGRFYLASGHSACVSPENFDGPLGMKYAREQAEGKAKDKLSELEGYRLYTGSNARIA